MQKYRATVIPELQVVTEPEGIKEAPIFPSCTVTRAMTRKMNNEDLEDSVVNLADTLCHTLMTRMPKNLVITSGQQKIWRLTLRSWKETN